MCCKELAGCRSLLQRKVAITTTTATSRKGRQYTPIAFARALELLYGGLKPAEVQDRGR